MADVETDKAIVTIPCPTTGRVLELRAQVGELVRVGAVIALFEPAPAVTSARAAGEPAGAANQAASVRVPGRRPLASPAVRRRAHELGLDLADIAGSGPGGRIEPADLDVAAAQTAAADTAAVGSAGADQVVPLRGVRRTIARTMTEAWRTIPHIIDYREADATELLHWRERLRSGAQDDKLRSALTLTPLLVGIAVHALRGHPYLNASVDTEREEITLRHDYNIGVATAAPDGLLVPVIKHADALGIAELALEVAELTSAARERRLRPEQLVGGTFTVNNYGSLGVWLGTPIIKPGEVANLGVGRVQERPVARGGVAVVRPIVALAVSGDHRVLDGHTLAAFVSDVVALIEDPGPLSGHDGQGASSGPGSPGAPIAIA
jgi:pyruvate dehydrogenase E2 component (dihydrolipoamide acetyltransferase)